LGNAELRLLNIRVEHYEPVSGSEKRIKKFERCRMKDNGSSFSFNDEE
jgi:hypothetical protein